MMRAEGLDPTLPYFHIYYICTELFLVGVGDEESYPDKRSHKFRCGHALYKAPTMALFCRGDERSCRSKQ